MKCKACHHLNIASEAECFLCGAKLYRGAPQAHGIVFVFFALCIFIPVFSAMGGSLKLLPLFGISTAGLRPSGGPGIVPMVLGFLGVSVCLTISRTQLPSQTQSLYCGIVTGACWTAYLIFVVGFGKELQSPRRRAERIEPQSIVARRERFDLAPVDPRRAAPVLADARGIAVREAGAVA